MPARASCKGFAYSLAGAVILSIATSRHCRCPVAAQPCLICEYSWEADTEELLVRLCSVTGETGPKINLIGFYPDSTDGFGKTFSSATGTGLDRLRRGLCHRSM